MSVGDRIVCRPLTDAADPLVEQVRATYEASFPVAERRDFELVRALVKESPFFTMYALLRGEAYVGFITAWRFDSFVYIEHFAIEQTARNGGIGAEAMGQFLAFTSLPVVLEVELPQEELSRRRIRFYERLGFVLDDHIYFQPPYHPGDQPLEMRLMQYGGLNLEQTFEAVRTCIYGEVYGVKAS